MNELKRVREQALLIDKEIDIATGNTGFDKILQQCLRNVAQAQLDKALKFVRIECDDQSLPENYHNNASLIITYNTAQQDMLKPDSEGNHWVKVGPKEEQCNQLKNKQ